MPDRIVIGKRGVLFIELKSPGKKPSPLQKREVALINEANTDVMAAWSSNWEDLKNLIDSIR